ncbi:MAG: Maf family protein [Hyphomicrobiales bacterium]|nr:Maf family protein [Hyphomicrobiales bacterium]
MMLWLADQPLVLASKSAGRRQLLAAAGIPIEVVVADIDERRIEAEASLTDPGMVATLLAREKARAVSRQQPGRLVLGADQTLTLGQQRFSKPKDRLGAREQLVALRGRSHALHSAVVIVRNDRTLFEHCEMAQLTMRPFSDGFLEAYLDSADAAVTTSVGGYQVESLGIQLFAQIEGDHPTILGLPLLSTLEALRGMGALRA